MRRFLLPALLLAAAGCASGEGNGDAAPPTEPGPEGSKPLWTATTPEDFAALDLRIECDRVRVVVPERLRDRTEVPGEGAPGPWDLAVGTVRIHVREIRPEVSFGGEFVAIAAEGIVKIRRTEGRFTTEEGPYRTAVFRNGRMLAR